MIVEHRGIPGVWQMKSLPHVSPLGHGESLHVSVHGVTADCW